MVVSSILQAVPGRLRAGFRYHEAELEMSYNRRTVMEKSDRFIGDEHAVGNDHVKKRRHRTERTAKMGMLVAIASVKNCSQKVSIESPIMIRRPVVQGFL